MEFQALINLKTRIRLTTWSNDILHVWRAYPGASQEPGIPARDVPRNPNDVVKRHPLPGCVLSYLHALLKQLKEGLPALPAPHVEWRWASM